MNCIMWSIALLLVLLPSCNKETRPGAPADDSTPPATVMDLTVQSATGSAVTLSWTAPGDDGAEGQAAQYDLRYSQAWLTGVGWDSATVAYPPPVPKVAGQRDSFTIIDLANGEWFFALKGADEVPNWSSMSNVVSATVDDTIPPSPVSDLTAISAGFAAVRLSWTAPGNDGAAGRAAEYELRRALTSITDENWKDAVRVDGVPRPAAAGQLRVFTVMGLELATHYFFALKTADGVPNWSRLSNVVDRSTLSVAVSRLTVTEPPFIGAGAPKWSPDGQTILTHADWHREHHYQLYLVPTSGGVPVQLTTNPYPFFSIDPCWSPDGTRIAYVSELSSDPAEIYTMGSTPGAVPSQVTHLGIRNLRGCAWSPDGTRIAFTTLVGDSPDELTAMIRVVPSTGGTAAPVVGANPGMEPAWSPDGMRIAFSSNRSGNYEIYVVSAGGGEPVQLTDDPADDSSPAWSPDGRQIAFASDRAGNFDVWLMPSEGGDPAPITFDPADEGSPSWSPDGTRVAFDRWTSEWVSDIWILAGQEAAGQ